MLGNLGICRKNGFKAWNPMADPFCFPSLENVFFLAGYNPNFLFYCRIARIFNRDFRLALDAWRGFNKRRGYNSYTFCSAERRRRNRRSPYGGVSRCYRHSCFYFSRRISFSGSNCRGGNHYPRRYFFKFLKYGDFDNFNNCFLGNLGIY